MFVRWRKRPLGARFREEHHYTDWLGFCTAMNEGEKRMANMSVFGILPTRASVEEATRQLRDLGFRQTDISVLVPENPGSKDLVHAKSTKAPEGAATGAGSGAAIGATLGWLAAVGSIALPGIGPLIAAGPIVAALAGAGAVGAVGGVAGALVGFGIPEYEAKRYEGRVRGGGILISVHADNAAWARKAADLLDEIGAEDVAGAAETKGDFANHDRPVARRS